MPSVVQVQCWLSNIFCKRQNKIDKKEKMFWRTAHSSIQSTAVRRSIAPPSKQRKLLILNILNSGKRGKVSLEAAVATLLPEVLPHRCSTGWEMRGAISWCTQSPSCPHRKGRWAPGHGREAGILPRFLKICYWYYYILWSEKKIPTQKLLSILNITVTINIKDKLRSTK